MLSIFGGSAYFRSEPTFLVALSLLLQFPLHALALLLFRLLVQPVEQFPFLALHDFRGIDSWRKSAVFELSELVVLLGLQTATSLLHFILSFQIELVEHSVTSHVLRSIR